MMQPSLMVKSFEVALTTTDETEGGNSKYLTCTTRTNMHTINIAKRVQITDYANAIKWIGERQNIILLKYLG